jgi:hypothetical protein
MEGRSIKANRIVKQVPYLPRQHAAASLAAALVDALVAALVAVHGAGGHEVKAAGDGGATATPNKTSQVL